jgi:diguanylate cyclase (GGDEF)-like protein
VAAAIARIAIVMVLLVSVLLVVAGESTSAATASRRANLAASVAADIEAVGQANTELESTFERASGLQDVTVRVAEFSTSNATGIRGTGAFSTYVQRSLHLARETAARSAYERATNAWDDFAAHFGALLVTPSTSTATIATSMQRLRVLQDARQSRLSNLRNLYLAEAAADETSVARSQQEVLNTAKWAIGIVSVVGVGLMVIAGRRASRRTKERGRIERERAMTERRTDFEARVQRSMALSVDEPAVLASVGHTFEAAGLRSAEFLMAESEGGELTRAIAPSAGGGCNVERASDCPAVRLRQRLDFSDADAIDACPFLRDRREMASECVCVPVTIGDQTLAILRAEAPAAEELSAEDADWISILARNAGERISALRAFANSQHQASTDSLTGLANRRTLEHAIASRTATGSYAVVFADIDHFKDLNDTFGHETGDDCLRAFARVLSRATRPGDLCARYGGEEFVVLLPDARSADAESIAERIQVLLAEELRDTRLAPFTVSVGIASTNHASSIDEVIRAADHAMFQAKSAGRNRIVAETV